MTGTDTVTHWIPERLVRTGDDVRCQWVDIGDTLFTDPFFETTLTRRRRDRPERRSTPLQQLHDEAAVVDLAAPSAFIFHVSRCGSTLLAQLFGCDETAVVLSEVPLLDELLRSTLPDRELLFGAALRLLGQRRSGAETRLVVKTDCWHLFYAATLRRLYPATPFVLLYRSPADVLASHHRARGMHMVPGLIEGTPFTVEFDATRHSLNQYAGSVLEGYYRAMVDVATADPLMVLVNYAEGFPAAFQRVAARLGLPLDDQLLARIEARCAYDGKNPQTPFSRPPADQLPDVDFSTLHRLFEQLEDIRHHTG